MEKKSLDLKKISKINVDEAKQLLKEHQVKNGKDKDASKGRKADKDKKIIKGITKRWATNTLLITALILLVLVATSILFIVQYYRNYVVSYLSDYANETVITYFTPYVDGNSEVFEQKAKEFLEKIK